MFKGLTTVIALMCLPGLNLQAGSILKCQAEDGSITYADTRCPEQQDLVSQRKYQTRIRKPPLSIKNIESLDEFPATQTLQPIARHAFQAKFVQALNSISMIKLGMTEYYLVRGDWPEDLEALGFEAGTMNSSLIQQTQVIEQGRLQLKLIQDFGTDKQIWIYPRSVMGGTQIEWICYSNFPSHDLKTTTGGTLCNSRNF